MSPAQLASQNLVLSLQRGMGGKAQSSVPSLPPAACVRSHAAAHAACHSAAAAGAAAASMHHFTCAVCCCGALCVICIMLLDRMRVTPARLAASHLGTPCVRAVLQEGMGPQMSDEHVSAIWLLPPYNVLRACCTAGGHGSADD